jgi:hypothetical protein
MLRPSSLFWKTGRVSVWVGDIKSDDELDDYLNSDQGFEQHFDVILDGGDCRESKVESISTPISKLVDGFSSCHSFAQDVIDAAKKAGIEEATTMLVWYACEYEPPIEQMNLKSPLKFLGVFQFFR